MGKYKKIIVDLILNTVSYAIPILALQFLILPWLAASVDSESYGLLLSLTGIVSVAGEMSCGTLANVRILMDEEYRRKGSLGNFKALYYIYLLVFSVIVAIVCWAMYCRDIFTIAFLLVYFIFFAARSYYLAGYRIDNRYAALMVNNLLLCAGYFLGFVVFKVTHIWQFVYIIGTAIATIHLWITTKLIREKAFVSADMKQLMTTTNSLMGSYCIGSGMSYFDRLYLYPALDGTAVSNYHVATMMGKMYGMVVTPMNMVLLSYLAKMKKIKKTYILLGVILVGVVAGVFIAVALGLSPWVISYLYPDYYDSAKQYIGIATVATTIFSSATILRVVAMRLINHKVILGIEIAYAVTYIILGVSMLAAGGLKAFCYATLISAVIRFLLFTVAMLGCKYKGI
jgi:O-antigen/teichoic acid export membrane protein